MAIKLLISDFDGTLVDTFEANFLAYRKAFSEVGLSLSREQYRNCFGYRFDKFMDACGVDAEDLRSKIRNLKGKFYPDYFDKFKVNKTLLLYIQTFHKSGGLTAIASTARRHNLLNALSNIGADNIFDLILSGESVSKGKPSPEIYQKVLEHFKKDSSEALVFEDSSVGFAAAEAAGINYIAITPTYFDYED